MRSKITIKAGDMSFEKTFSSRQEMKQCFDNAVSFCIGIPHTVFTSTEMEYDLHDDDTEEQSEEDEIIENSFPPVEEAIDHVVGNNYPVPLRSKIDGVTREDEPVEGYTGFLHIECKHCGAVRTFCTKEPINDFYCKECGQHTSLNNLVSVEAICSGCGNKWRYYTNRTRDKFELECVRCHTKIPVYYDDVSEGFLTQKSE